MFKGGSHVVSIERTSSSSEWVRCCIYYIYVTQYIQYQRCREELYLLFCSVLEFGPVPTPPTPCYEALRFGLLHPIRRPKANEASPCACELVPCVSRFMYRFRVTSVPFAGGAVHVPVDGVRTRAHARRQDTQLTKTSIKIKNIQQAKLL